MVLPAENFIKQRQQTQSTKYVVQPVCGPLLLVLLVVDQPAMGKKLIRNIQMKTSVKNMKGVHCSHSLYCSHCIFDVSWFLFFAFSCVSRSC